MNRSKLKKIGEAVDLLRKLDKKDRERVLKCIRMKNQEEGMNCLRILAESYRLK